MKTETKSLLQKEIQEEFEDLKEMSLGSEEYRATVDGLTKLVDREIEIERLKIETKEKSRQFEEEKKDRLIKNILTGVGIVVPSAITIWGTLKSFKFEEEGTITTVIGRGFINKLLPKK